MIWKSFILAAAIAALEVNALPQRTPLSTSPSIRNSSNPMDVKIENPKIDIINKGTLSSSEINELKKETMESNSLVRRDDQGVFAESPTLIGDTEAGGQPFSVDGPFSSIEIFPGKNALRGIRVKNLDGNETVFGSTDEVKGVKRPGSFEFDDEEVITDFTIQYKDHRFSGDTYISGIHFGTSKGHKYNATCEDSGDETVVKSVGSGYPIRFHGILKPVKQEKDAVNAISALGVEFLDELRSIEMVSAEYVGFESISDKPADGGKTLIAGKQTLDNRNSSIAQTFSLTNTKMVTKSYAFTFQIALLVGVSTTMSVKAKVPELFEVDGTQNYMWQLTTTLSTTFTHSEAITQGATFALSCPAGKFCQAASVFNTFDLDMPFSGQFEATTKRGDKSAFTRKGVYKSSDVSAMKLEVNQYDAAPVRRSY